MSQWGLPTSDISKGTATPDQCSTHGDSDGNAFDEFDEGFGAGRGSGSGPDDATTDWQLTSDSGEAATHIECALNSVTDPASSSNHIIRARIVKVASAGDCSTLNGTGQQNDVTVLLKEGTTQRATITQTATGSWATMSYTLSGAEADAITNYADLRLRVYKDEIGGGAGKVVNCSALEFECPDAPPSVDQSQWGPPTQQLLNSGGFVGRRFN